MYLLLKLQIWYQFPSNKLWIFLLFIDDFNPGKRYESTGGTYTYTTAKILHPSDDYVANTQTTSWYVEFGIFSKGMCANVSVSHFCWNIFLMIFRILSILLSIYTWAIPL